MHDEAGAPAAYNPVMRAVHWTTLVLVAAAFVAVWIAGSGLAGVYTRATVQLHRSFGLTIAALTLFRLLWRWRSRIPALPADVPRLQKLAARATEGMIYLLLVVQPAIGLLHANAYGVRANFYFLGELPPVIGKDRTLAASLADVHGFLGYSLLALIGLHAAAALYHHFIRGDEVLMTMLPDRFRRRTR